MFDRISNSFALARSSWEVLKQNKKLALFPVFSGLGTFLVLLSFGIPLVILAVQGRIDLDQNGQPPWWVYPVAFAFYFCNYFVIVFCNAALISCALMHFNGETPTLGDGFAAAGRRLPQILAWALVSATVGMLLKAVENVHEKAGAFLSAILGAAWTIMTYFVVPVLVVEKVGPFEAIRRSVAVLRKTWGEALIGHIGVGLFVLLLSLPGFLLLVAGVAVAGMGSLALGLTVAVLGVVYLLIASAVGAALSTIFQSALYQYAAFEQVPSGFDADTLRDAFHSKR
jgi:hypothetical protein